MRKLMFHVVVSDLDGTLLTSNHQITPFTKNILQQLITTHHINFVLATGRHYINVTQICNDLKIHAYMITANGARIHNTHGKLIASYNLEIDIIPNLLNIVHYDENITTNIFRNNEWLINRNQYNQKNIRREFGHKYKIYYKDDVPLDGIFKIYFTSNQHHRLLSLENDLNALKDNRINVSFSLPTCLEVMPGTVSKGRALKQVVNLLGYQLKDCISFGDGMNDQEMLSITGKGCIMYNAQQRLKDTLPSLEVIGSNDEEAVPHYLNNLYFKGY